MRILYLSQYFPPEVGATQTRAYEMARNFVRLGHQVTMLAEIPNHPSGIISPEYLGKVYERTELEGIDVIRLWVKTSPVKNFRNRMLFYLTFMVNATLAGILLARKRYDVIYASSPPLFIGGAALALSYLRRIPLVFEVRDLWPESAVALGELSSPRVIHWATRLEEACYQRSKIVVVVTQGIQKKLTMRGIPADKLALIPNGANVNHFQFRQDRREHLRRELGLEGKFIVAYIGTLGIAYDFETIFSAAQKLQSEPNIHFLIIGEGPQKAEVTAMATEYALANLTILPEQPYELIPNYFSSADVVLITYRDNKLFSGALPVKMFDALACQRPVLLSSVEGEASQMINEANAGLVVPPEDSDQVVKGLLKLALSPPLREKMGFNGRDYTVLHYSRKALAEKLAEMLETM